MKKRQLKSVFAFFGALTLSASVLAGCGKDDASSSSASESAAPESSSEVASESSVAEEDGLPWDDAANGYKIEQDVLDGKAPLKLWLDNDDYAAATIAAFNAKYPTIKVEYEKVGSVDARAKIALDGEAGLGPDIFVQPHDGMGPSIQDAVIGPMGKYTAQLQERMGASSLGTVMHDGEAYGVPVSTESLALFYNKTLLKELTGSDVPATDWQQIVDLAGKYNNKSKNQWTIRWEAGNSYVSYWALSAFGYDVFGKDGTDATKTDFESEAAKKGLEFLASARKIWDVNSGDATWDTTTLEFAKGKTPYLIVGPWGIADSSKGATENKFEFGVTTLPKIEGNAPITFSGNQIVCVSSYSKYPGAARVLAMFMQSKEGAEAMFKSTGKLPALKEQFLTEVAGVGSDPYLKGVAAQALTSKPMPSIPEMASWWDPAKFMMVNVWDGLMTPADAQKKAVDDYNTALAAAGQK